MNRAAFLFRVNCCIGILSLIANCLLLLIILRRKKDARNKFTPFSFIFIAVGSSFSIIHAAYSPFYFSGDGMIGFISTSAISNRFVLARCAELWIVLFLGILVCVAYSFLYRYCLICNPSVLQWFHTTRKLVVIVVAGISLNFLTTFTVVYVILPTTPASLVKLDEHFGRSEVNFLADHAITLDIDNVPNGLHIMVALICVLCELSMAIGVSVMCGIKIQLNLSRHQMSPKTRKAHMRALRLLIVQAINPAVFLYTPSSVQTLTVLLRLPLIEYLSWTLSGLLTFFPFVNAVVILLFSEDYRRYAQAVLTQRKFNVSSIGSSTNQRSKFQNVSGSFGPTQNSRA